MSILTNARAGTPTGPKGGGHVIDVDERSFREAVLERSRSVPIVVDFWAPWCGPCRTLGPMLEKLAAEANGAFVLAKINVDNNPRLAQAFQVQGIPAVKAVRDGQVVDEFTGALPESQVRAWLKRLMPVPRADQMAEQAALLEAQDPQRAEMQYRAALAVDPVHAPSLLGLGKILAAQGNDEGLATLRQIPSDSPQYTQAQAWLSLASTLADAEPTPAAALRERIARDPADMEARYQLALQQVQGVQYDEAIDSLLEIVSRNRTFRADGARKLLLMLFDALGDKHALVASGRRTLANLLF